MFFGKNGLDRIAALSPLAGTHAASRGCLDRIRISHAAARHLADRAGSDLFATTDDDVVSNPLLRSWIGRIEKGAQRERSAATLIEAVIASQRFHVLGRAEAFCHAKGRDLTGGGCGCPSADTAGISSDKQALSRSFTPSIEFGAEIPLGFMPFVLAS